MLVIGLGGLLILPAVGQQVWYPGTATSDATSGDESDGSMAPNAEDDNANAQTSQEPTDAMDNPTEPATAESPIIDASDLSVPLQVVATSDVASLVAWRTELDNQQKQFSDELLAAPENEVRALKANFDAQYAAELNAMLPAGDAVSIPPPAEALNHLASDLLGLEQSLPSGDAQQLATAQQVEADMQQFPQASLEQQEALILNLRRLLAQKQQAANAQASPATASATDSSGVQSAQDAASQARAAWIASLPPEDQAYLQAQAQRTQALQAILQMPPDQETATLQTFREQAVSGGTSTSDADSPSGPPANDGVNQP